MLLQAVPNSAQAVAGSGSALLSGPPTPERSLVRLRDDPVTPPGPSEADLALARRLRDYASGELLWQLLACYIDIYHRLYHSD